MAKKTEKILPFIGATLSSTHKNIDDQLIYFYNETVKYNIHDKSHLFLLQIPIGIRFTKNHFFIQANTTLSIISYSIGSQKFNSSSETNTFKSQENKYSKLLFIDQLIKEKYFFQNVFELNIGY